MEDLSEQNVKDQYRETQDWMRRRKRRKAKPIFLCFTDGDNVGLCSKLFGVLETSEDLERLASMLFDKSLFTNISKITHHLDCVDVRFGKSGGVEIDADVVETILNWYRLGRNFKTSSEYN